MKQLKKHQGFTFIEMLVVVTIMAVLTAVGTSSFKVANQKARDGRRQGDLEQIRAALELYRTDEGLYPLTGIIVADKIESTSITYMADIPSDPKSNQKYYYASGTGKTYALCAAIEIGGDTGVTGCGGVAACGAECNYKVTNPQ